MIWLREIFYSVLGNQLQVESTRYLKRIKKWIAITNRVCSVLPCERALIKWRDVFGAVCASSGMVCKVADFGLSRSGKASTESTALEGEHETYYRSTLKLACQSSVLTLTTQEYSFKVLLACDVTANRLLIDSTIVNVYMDYI